MSRTIIDYCWENDGFINFSSEDVSDDRLQILRNTLELFLCREGAYKNTYGEIYFDEEDGYTLDFRDRDPEDCVE